MALAKPLRMRTTLIAATLILAGCGSRSHEVLLDGGGDGISRADGEPDDLGLDAPPSSCTPTSPAKGDGVSRSVTFSVSATGSGKAWLVTSGEWCAPFAISGLRLSAPYTVGCEGPPPPSPYVSGALPLSSKPGLRWDGTRLTPHTECLDCADQGWPGMGVVPLTVYTSISAAPGSYTATLGVLETIPDNCSEDTNGALDCWDPGNGWGNNMTGDTCPMPARVVTVDFTLPQAAGDITVPVEVATP